MLHLPFDRELNLPPVEKLGKPRAEGEDETVGDVLPDGRRHADDASLDAPRQHRLARAERRTITRSTREQRTDACLRKEDPSTRFEKRHRIRLRHERGKSASHLGGCEQLVRQPVLLRRCQRTAYELTIFGPNHQAAGPYEQPLAHLALELLPQPAGPLNQRDVGWVLEVRLANDPRAAMGRAMRVRRRITIDSQNAKAAARQLARRGTSHRAEPSDDDVPALGHCLSLEADSQADQRLGVVDHHFLEADVERQARGEAERDAAAERERRSRLRLLTRSEAALDIELGLPPEEGRLDEWRDGDVSTPGDKGERNSHANREPACTDLDALASQVGIEHVAAAKADRRVQAENEGLPRVARPD